MPNWNSVDAVAGRITLVEGYLLNIGNRATVLTSSETISYEQRFCMSFFNLCLHNTTNSDIVASIYVFPKINSRTSDEETQGMNLEDSGSNLYYCHPHWNSSHYPFC